MGILVFLGQNPVLRFLGANADMWEYAKSYLQILCFGAPAMMFNTAFANVLRGMGAVKEGMVSNLFATLTNVVLDPIFILVLNFGVAGAAVATVLDNLVGCAYLIWYTVKKDSGLSLSLRCSLTRSLPGLLHRK